MKVSNCCGALFVEPGWPDNDLCSACKEHADAIDEEEPSIIANIRSPLFNPVIDMPSESEEAKQRSINKIKKQERL